MSQKQVIPTNRPSQGFKGRGKSNNNNNRNSGGGSPRVNTHTGNTIRTQEQKRKTVFKAVLDSPFNISWPEVSVKDQNEILDALCDALLVMKDSPSLRSGLIRSAKSTYKKMRTLDKVIKVENDDDGLNKNDMSSNNILTSREQQSTTTTPPPMRSNIFFGINEVTKHLERMTNPHPLIPANPNYQLSDSLISRKYHSLEIVFVCKADLLPQFYSHFPTMCNIAGDVLLVPLPSGASKRISDVVKFKRVSCIGVKTNAPGFTRIYKMVKEKVKPVNAPWLSPLKPLLNDRKVLKEEVKKEKVEKNFTYSSSSSNSLKRKQVEMTYDDEPKIKVEVASSSHTTSSPSIFFFGQQPQIKIEATSTQLKPTSFDYVPTQIKQLITTAPINKDQAREKRREKKLKYKQRKMNTK